MPTSNTPLNRIDDPLYNSRLIKNYVEYVKEFHPEVDIESLLNYAGISTYEVEDPGHWLNQSQVDRFHQILVQKTADPTISRKVGRYAGSSQAAGILRQYALGLMTPAAVYRMLERFTSNLSRATEFKTKRISSNKVEIEVTTKPLVEEKL